ncbi:SNF5-domain-containing protein [Rhizopogon vinicolor AM-OR11-026]|uniref:SNF5-domain-containing protein n=1 Tax=Rhizopogon vinicolor AM-OR11-026 TaxID=1314800 RepID=A0A1B7NHW7_9AGAM|nr:SNF5-domain-containing protein [Rhizopogon vinicolor AM-OR11-026]
MTDATSSTAYPTNMTNLTDLQLRQTITQLSNAANNPTNQFQHYVSPAPQQSTSKAHPPNPPRHPLPVVPQALHSTYPSRLRTGTTLLVQPILTQPSAAVGNTRASTRRGGMINYAEPGSGDEFPDAGAIESDDSDFVASGGTRTTLRTRRQLGTGMSVFHSGSGMSTPQPTQAPARSTPVHMQNDKGELDQSYLGMIPPSRFIKQKPIVPTAHEYPLPDMLHAQAQTRTSLVPIRVEFETETLRIRDCFVWNLNETLVKPESFAKVFCADLDLPAAPWAETVANQIRAQLEDHEGVASMDLGVDHAMDLDPYAESGDEIPECRVILSIDVQIAAYHLLDHIEWDLLSPLTPEAFASQLCTELGLSGEALPLIAHAIHEELIKHKKDAIEWGVIGGDKEAEGMKDKTGLGMGWGRTKGPKILHSVWREWTEAEEFRTRFEVLTAEEVERREIEKERASRRLRRETSKFQTTRTRRR